MTELLWHANSRHSNNSAVPHSWTMPYQVIVYLTNIWTGVIVSMWQTKQYHLSNHIVWTMTSYTIEESEFQRPRIGTQTLIIPTSQLLFQSFFFLSINQVCHHILNCEIFKLSLTTYKRLCPSVCLCVISCHFIIYDLNAPIHCSDTLN